MNVPKDLHSSIVLKLDDFYRSNKIPHIIFHGSSGTGKRTIVYDFLNKIYDNDKQKLKTNVMIVNCAHFKGIKFIREELKFFAKSNMQANNGKLFKTIVLLNADSLTIDAQSALRRCIELFSHTTRFFIVVENKDKLLNPICSRFCKIYVPEFFENGNIHNLHTASLNPRYRELPSSVIETICNIRRGQIPDTHKHIVKLTEDLYNGGYSTLDLVHFIKTNTCSLWTELEIIDIVMYYEKVKSEYRSEKMLMFAVGIRGTVGSP
jgi:Cdc6-like AAA superfamily ATPase